MDKYNLIKLSNMGIKNLRAAERFGVGILVIVVVIITLAILC